jgi:acyl carrier protein
MSVASDTKPSTTPSLTTLDRVRAILREQLGIDTTIEIEPTHSLSADLNCDSLDAIEIIMAAEEAFGIEVDDDDIEAIKTVADMVARIDALLAEKAGAA